jgi:peptidoglycan/xylan/chitin deacetylase (PgdA/CDA1 family)
MNATEKDVLKNNPYLMETEHLVRSKSWIRVVNYHNTKIRDKDRFEQEVRIFSENYSPVSFTDLDTFFNTKKWPHEKPGLIPAVFEGWRTGHDVFLDILNKYGFKGWYYIPAFFPDVPIQEQIPFCKPHGLRLFAAEDYDDPRCCMTWDEIREVAKTNEICCHTGTHAELDENMSDDTLRREIVDSKKKLEDEIGREVPVFCWRGGQDYKHSEFAHKYFEEAGYRYIVSNLKIERIR